MGFRDRIMHAWNAFINQKPEERIHVYNEGVTYSTRPDRRRYSLSNEQSIISSIYTRISVDVAAVEIHHVRLDKDDRYLHNEDSGLENCLTLEANIDQAGTAFRQDIGMTTIENGVACIVPVDTTLDPTKSTGYEIKTMRVGTIINWMPEHVTVRLYNDKLGKKEDIILRKRQVAIVENPLFNVMNEPNSTLQRLIRKLNLLDAIDEQSGSGKLDLIIQLPYVIKTEAKREQAEQRRKDIEVQLKDSQYGIAYTDGTEKITQLNRPAENNLLKQIEFLTQMLYGQLGLTEDVMNGTADEKAMLNYQNRTINPIVRAIVEAMKRSFLTKTAISQKQSIKALRNPFELVPVESIAEIADKFTRNEILTSNEIRQVIGFKPSSDKKADKLVNSNMPQPDEKPDSTAPDVPGPESAQLPTQTRKETANEA